MKWYAIILSLLLQGSIWAPCVKASEAELEWNDAVGLAKQGEYDFAFMGFRSIRDDYPQSRFGLAAAFAQGEYYFLQNNLDLASGEFKDFYVQFPQHDESLIALAYLYKIAQTQHDQKKMNAYRSLIASFKQMTFIFNDQKIFKFVSGFGRHHKLVCTINKVDLYVNEKLFVEIPF